MINVIYKSKFIDKGSLISAAFTDKGNHLESFHIFAELY